MCVCVCVCVCVCLFTCIITYTFVVENYKTVICPESFRIVFYTDDIELYTEESITI